VVRAAAHQVAYQVAGRFGRRRRLIPIIPTMTAVAAR
jgi:hypothetical protein